MRPGRKPHDLGGGYDDPEVRGNRNATVSRGTMNRKADPQSGFSVMGAILRHRYVALLLVVVGAAGGAGYGVAKPPQPAATELVVVHDPNYSGADGSVDARYAADQARLMKGFGVAEGASQLLSAQKPPIRLTAAAVASALTVSASSSDNTLSITFKAPSAATARAGVAAVEKSYENSVAQSQHQLIAAQVAAIDSALAAIQRTNAAISKTNPAATAANDQLASSQLLAERAQLVTANADPTPGVAGSTPPQLTRPKKTSAAAKDSVFGLILGMMCASLVCYLVANRRRRVLAADDIEAMFGVALLGELGGGSGGRSRSGQEVESVLSAAALEARCRMLGARVVAVVGAAPHGGTIEAVSALASGYEARGLTPLVASLSRGVRHSPGAGDHPVVLVTVPDVRGDSSIGELGGLDAAVIIVRRRCSARAVRDALEVLEKLSLPVLGYIFVWRPGRSNQRTAPQPGAVTAESAVMASETV